MKKPWRVVGIPGMWSNEATLMKALRDIVPDGMEFQCLTLEGHQSHDPHDSTLAKASIRDYRESVLRQLRELHEKFRLILVGHSMGGLLAMMAAQEGLAEGLVLLAPGAPKGVWNFSPTLVPLILDVNLHQFRTPSDPWSKPHLPSSWVARYTLFPHDPIDPQAHDRLYRGLVGESLRALNENLMEPIVKWIMREKRPGHAREVDFSKIQVPVLMVYGDRDRITPKCIGYGILKRLPKETSHELLIIPGASHWIFEESSWLESRNDRPPVSHTLKAWITGQTKDV